MRFSPDVQPGHPAWARTLACARWKASRSLSIAAGTLMRMSWRGGSGCGLSSAIAISPHDRGGLVPPFLCPEPFTQVVDTAGRAPSGRPGGPGFVGLLGFGGQPDALLAVEQAVQAGREHAADQGRHDEQPHLAEGRAA